MRIILGKLNDEMLLNVASKAATFCSEVDAAVAYADSKDHPLFQTCKDKGLHLTFYGLLDDGGAVSPLLLRELLSWKASQRDVRLVKHNFHAKVIWWRGYGAYVGSANLTHKAWFHNVEAGVFLEEEELRASQAANDLEALFEHLASNSIPVIDEMVEHLQQLAEERRRLVDVASSKISAKFEQFFGHLPDNPALTVKPAKGQRENKAQRAFVTEWMRTLQLLRDLSKEFKALRLRPKWVAEDAHATVHFDQFLHAYYYDQVRGSGIEDDDELSGLEKVEAGFARNHSNPAGALKSAAEWWASLPSDLFGEEQFIRETAPSMQRAFSQEGVKAMTLATCKDALRNVNAFRMHARQTRNAEFGLPADHHESVEQRADRLCAWLWDRRTPTGKTVREALEFVLWGSAPSDMERRLWLAISDPAFRLPHFGQSTLGEAVGWARPDQYPPRNNRTNKALRALGHDIKLFSKS